VKVSQCSIGNKYITTSFCLFEHDRIPLAASPELSNEQSRQPSIYYSFKAYKKLQPPAVAYSVVSKLAAFFLRLKPSEIPPSTSLLQVKQRRVAIVTGSNTGVGFQTAKSLVQDHGMEVVLACRSTEKGTNACQEINAEAQGSGRAVFIQTLDISDLESVRSFAKVIQKRYETIHVLVNNAGIAHGTATPVEYPDHLDFIFTSNFLGHFLLTNLLVDQSRRIVNLSSIAHHVTKYADGDDDNIHDPAYWRTMATQPTTNNNDDDGKAPKFTYGPSKLAALLFSIELNRRYGENKGLRSIAANPGAVYVSYFPEPFLCGHAYPIDSYTNTWFASLLLQPQK
jgi:NAD(P)-dependent dehydrogenase (short-subunit alcohol dehydrogenase family)